MNVFDSYTYTVLQALTEHRVEFLVVGGYAVNFYGYIRTTGDIDLWIKPTNGENKSKVIAAFKQMAIAPEVLNEINRLDFTQMQVLSDGQEPYRIDFLTYISQINFEEAWAKRKLVELDGLEIPFVHYDHLILSKITTGRAKDMLDVEELQKINGGS